jgi:hypothetical protein
VCPATTLRFFLPQQPDAIDGILGLKPDIASMVLRATRGRPPNARLLFSFIHASQLSSLSRLVAVATISKFRE